MVASSPPQPTLQLTGQVIAVLRTDHASEYLPVIESLVAGGVRFIELTLTTGGVFDHLAEIREAFGDTAEIGIGTVTTTGQAVRALDGGAQFLVTPSTNLDIIHTAVARGIPIVPGGLTPTELHAGWSAARQPSRSSPLPLWGRTTSVTSTGRSPRCSSYPVAESPSRTHLGGFRPAPSPSALAAHWWVTPSTAEALPNSQKGHDS